MAVYARSWKELADKSGESEATLTRFKRLGGFPKKCKSGWNVERVVRFVERERQRKQKELEKSGTTLDALRAEKLQLEIDEGRLKLRQLQGELMPVQEHLEVLREHAAIVNEGFAQWVSMVSALTHNAELVKKARGIRDRVRTYLMAQLEG